MGRGWHDPIFIGNYYASSGDSLLIVDSAPASSLTEELTAMVANTAGNFGPLLQPLRKPDTRGNRWNNARTSGNTARYPARLSEGTVA